MQNIRPRQLAISLILLVAATVGFFGLLPHISQFKGSLEAAQAAHWWLVAAALVSVAIAYACSAGVYQLLSYHRLRFRTTLLVELAGLLVNRVVPSGIGGLGLNFLYLRTQKHSRIQAGTVVALNNLLGFIGHLLLLGIVLLSFRARPVTVDAPQLSATSLYVLSLGVLLLVTALYLFRRKIIAQATLLYRYYARRPGRVPLALLTSCGLTLANVLSLWLCCQALQITIPFGVVFLIFTFGIAAGTVIPLPGGLGGTEAGLLGGLISQHVKPSTALAAVLLYRLLSFWLGLLVGAAALYGVYRSKAVKLKP